MKNNWQTKKLGDLLELFDAGTWGEEDPNGLPLLRSTNMQNGNLILDDLKTIALPQEKIDQYTLLEGDILMTKSSGSVNHIGKSLFITHDMSGKYGFSNFTQRLRPDKSQVLSEWIYYKVSDPATRDFLLGASQTTTGLRNLKVSELKELEIPLPPLSTQRSIVAKLDEKFAKLSKAKQLREEAILDTSKILARTLGEIFEEGKEKGWEEVSLDDVSDIKGGKRLPKGHSLLQTKTNHPYIRVADFIPFGIDSNNLKYISDETFKSISRYTISSGDVFFSIAGTIGSTGVVPDYLNGANLTENAAKLTNLRNIDQQYLMYMLASDEIKKQIKGDTIQSTIPKFGLFRIAKLIIPLPSLNIQKEIVARLDILSEKLRTLRELQQSQLGDMKKLEKAYLREAFRGEL